MKNFLTYLFLILPVVLLAQIDTQSRFQSDYREYYIWNEASSSYLLQEKEYEHSIIEIREIGSKNHGYVAISLSDDGRSRLFHGSINGYTVNDKKEPTWQLLSRTMKSKVTYNPDENTFTYLYDAGDMRYEKIIIFKVDLSQPPELRN